MMHVLIILIVATTAFVSSIIADCHTRETNEPSGWSVLYFFGLFIVLGAAIGSAISVKTMFIIFGVAIAISVIRMLNFKKIIEFIGKMGP